MWLIASFSRSVVSRCTHAGLNTGLFMQKCKPCAITTPRPPKAQLWRPSIAHESYTRPGIPSVRRGQLCLTRSRLVILQKCTTNGTFFPQNFPHPIDPRMAEGGRASLDRDSGCRLSARVPDNLTYIATLGKSYVEYRCLIPELPYVDLDRLH